jgi:hypothetical protein
MWDRAASATGAQERKHGRIDFTQGAPMALPEGAPKARPAGIEDRSGRLAGAGEQVPA